MLPNSCLLQIVVVIINSPDSQADSLGWSKSESDRFTVRSSHNLVAGWKNNGDRQGWNRIWKLPIQEKVCALFWRIAHKAILTNSARSRRNIAFSASCFRCLHHTEDVLHVLKDCPESSEVWKAFLAPQLCSSFFESELRKWLDLNLSNKPRRNLFEAWPKKLALICY